MLKGGDVFAEIAFIVIFVTTMCFKYQEKRTKCGADILEQLTENHFFAKYYVSTVKPV